MKTVNQYAQDCDCNSGAKWLRPISGEEGESLIRMIDNSTRPDGIGSMWAKRKLAGHIHYLICYREMLIKNEIRQTLDSPHICEQICSLSPPTGKQGEGKSDV